jgi:hypothetical protein
MTVTRLCGWGKAYGTGPVCRAMESVGPGKSEEETVEEIFLTLRHWRSRGFMEATP